MSETKKEILERVLLLMNYDNKRTLSENYNIVLEELQLPNFSDLYGQALWLNQNKIGNKDYNSIWDLFLVNVKNSSLTKLKEVSKKLSQNGFGPITPGLYGFNKPNAGIANVIIENQIYALSYKLWDEKTKGGKIMAFDDSRVLITKPSPPQYNLLNSLVSLNLEQLIGGSYKGKLPGQIISDKQVKSGDSKNKCYFNNKTEGDSFRVYVNSVYKNVASEMDLDNSGPFCNSNINKTYEYKLPKGSTFKTVGESYKSFISYNPKKAKEDLMKISREDLGYGGDVINAQRDIQTQLKNAEEKKKNLETAKKIEDLDTQNELEKTKLRNNILSKYDFSTFPNPVDFNMGRPVYKNGVSIWKEPKTGKVFNIIGKTLKDIQDEIVRDYEWEETQKLESEIINDPRLVQIFGKNRIDVKLKECDRDKLLQFFKSVLDGRYKSSGNIIGKFAIDNNGNSYLVTWPKNQEIPCTDKFWDEYGLYIQIGGMLLVGLLTQGMSLPASAALFIDLAADTALNLYSLKKNTEAQDKDAMALDMAFIFLPFIMASAPIKSMLKSAKFGDSVINSVESKLNSLPNNASRSQMENLLNSMTPEEQRLISELGSTEYSEQIKNVSKQTLENLKRNSNAPLRRKLSDVIIYTMAYGTPIAAYTLKKIKDVESLYKKQQKNFSEEERAVWIKAINSLPSKNFDSLVSEWEKNPESFSKILKNENFNKSVKQLQNIKSESEVKQVVEKIKGNMTQFIQDLMNESESLPKEDNKITKPPKM